jgi:hypothetical protein
MISMKGCSQMVFYTPFHPPKHKDQPPKADLRREITPWKALVWAYADECLAAATNGLTADVGYALSHPENGWVQTQYEERSARGTINGLLPAHEDAFVIDSWLWHVACARDPKPYHAIRAAAEKRCPVAPSSDFPDLACGPVFRANGKIAMEYPLGRNDRPYLCLVTYTGYSEDEKRRQQALYDLFQNAMACMQDIDLVKWKITPHTHS